MPRKKVRIGYRRLLRGAEPIITDSLSASIQAALRFEIEGVRVNDAQKLRSYQDPDYGTLLLNGRLPAANGDVYGEFVRFDPQANIPLLMQNAGSAGELEIREMGKPNDAEFLNGMSFFLIRGDHVFVIDQDFSNPMMERYIRWLLNTLCPVAERDARLPLVPKLALRDRPERMPNVETFEVKPPPLRPPGFEFEDDEDPVRVERRTLMTDIMGILRAANIDTARIDTLMREKGASVQLNMEIIFKSGRKKLKLDGNEALALVRDVPDADLVLHGDGMRRNRGVLERLGDQADIEQKGNILDRRDAWRALKETADKYEDDGLI